MRADDDYELKLPPVHEMVFRDLQGWFEMARYFPPADSAKELKERFAFWADFFGQAEDVLRENGEQQQDRPRRGRRAAHGKEGAAAAN